jgi:hypothetical protein
MVQPTQPEPGPTGRLQFPAAGVADSGLVADRVPLAIS